MVVSISLSYLILTLPESTAAVVGYLADYNSTNHILSRFFDNIFGVFIVANNSVNFIIYILMTQSMRKEFLKMIRCLGNQSVPAGQNQHINLEPCPREIGTPDPIQVAYM
jgi:hypothetical protein